MDIEQVKRLKQQLQEQIIDKIKDFNFQTGLRVTDLNLTRYESHSNSGAVTITAYKLAIEIDI